MMEFTAEMIAGFLGGDILGDKNASVHTVSSIEEGKAGSLAYLTNPKYEPFLYTTGASIVLVDRSFEPAQPVAATLIKVDDAAACVVKLLSMYNAAKPRRKGISDRASISGKAQVGEECYIGDFTVVEEGVKIGKDGSMLKSGDEYHYIPAWPADTIDATGAGDTYAAGFIYAHSLGMPLKVCGEVGSIIAAKVVEVIGTKIDIPRWKTAKQEIRELIAKYI